MQYLVKLRRQTLCKLVKLKGLLHSLTLSWDFAVMNRWIKLSSCSSFSLFNTALAAGGAASLIGEHSGHVPWIGEVDWD
eukprot:9203619-Pyramimonas_sp.AAC.1